MRVPRTAHGHLLTPLPSAAKQWGSGVFFITVRPHL